MTAKSSIISLSPLSSLKSLKSLFTLAALTCCLASCVKEPLYDTDHPNHGMLTLTTVWDDRGEGIEIPAGHTVRTKHASSEHSHTAALTGTANTLNELFPAGEHRIHLYNTAENISISGTTATADYATGALGWLFTGTETVTVEKDKKHHLTVAMHQMVRQLTLELEITGGAKDRITGLSASLSGVAGAVNIENGNPEGSAAAAVPAFEQQPGGKHKAVIRLLGITGSAQTLSLTLHFEGNTPSPHTVTSDLSVQLAAFNADRKTPLTLRSTLEVTSEAGFTATIGEWTEQEGTIIAE